MPAEDASGRSTGSGLGWARTALAVGEHVQVRLACRHVSAGVPHTLLKHIGLVDA